MLPAGKEEKKMPVEIINHWDFEYFHTLKNCLP